MTTLAALATRRITGPREVVMNEHKRDSVEEIDALISAVLNGDERAWQELVGHVHRLAATTTRRRHPRRDDDFVHSVALRTVERLNREERRALRQFLQARERYPTLELAAWLHTLINHSIIDEIRAQPEISRVRTEHGRELGQRPHVEIDDQHAITDGASTLLQSIEVRRVLRWILDSNFPEDQRRALSLWLDGHPTSDIANVLSQSIDDTQRLLRAARQRLRRQFEETL